MKISHSNCWTATRSRLAAPTSFGVKGGVRPQAAADATFMGSDTWSPPIT